MSRISRESYNANYFHVMVQGIKKEKIFYDDSYKKYYIDKMLSKSKDFNIPILSYCLMTNHSHMIVYCNEISILSKYMKSLNITYSHHYNKLENRVGYVFRNRFSSLPIFNQKYLITCIKYIHNNPVKAGIVTNHSDYNYSSYNDYVNFTGIMNDTNLKFINFDKNTYSDVLLKYDNYTNDEKYYQLNLKLYNKFNSTKNTENKLKIKKLLENSDNLAYEDLLDILTIL